MSSLYQSGRTKLYLERGERFKLTGSLLPIGKDSKVTESLNLTPSERLYMLRKLLVEKQQDCY